MRIAYLIAEDLENHPGLSRKILGQSRYWEEQGNNDVFLVMHADRKVLKPCGEIVFQERETDSACDKEHRFFKLLKKYRQYLFISKALSFINPDITYTRYLFPFFGFLSFLRGSGSLIIEVNSDDRVEYYIKHKLTGFYNQLFRNKLFRRATGLVFVTKELVNNNSFSKFNSLLITIGNGINVDDFPAIIDTQNEKPNLCFIGSPGQKWHGLDKLLTLVKLLPNCIVHVIGPSQEECLALWHELPLNIKFHGYLTEVDAIDVISRMDIGISTLALHRINMNEACPLKTRQYFALGLPVIGAHFDPDLPDGADFFLNLPNVENNIEPMKEEILNFVNGSFQNDSLRYSIRQFAYQYLSERKKENSRLNFFQECSKETV